MTPRFAVAIDPIFLHVLELLERCSSGENPDPQEERPRIVALIDQAEAVLGAGGEWEAAKYGVVSWIDEVLVDAPWTGAEWWSNHVLEVQYFATRLCSERFFLKAREASESLERDALEVYYNCVLLGFRGVYGDQELAASFAQTHGLPPDLEAWARQASLSIRLGQGRPPLAVVRQDVTGASPRRTRSAVGWIWVAAGVGVLLNAVAFWYR